jgi:hypothetical protein
MAGSVNKGTRRAGGADEARHDVVLGGAIDRGPFCRRRVTRSSVEARPGGTDLNCGDLAHPHVEAACLYPCPCRMATSPLFTPGHRHSAGYPSWRRAQGRLVPPAGRPFHVCSLPEFRIVAHDAWHTGIRPGPDRMIGVVVPGAADAADKMIGHLRHQQPFRQVETAGVDIEVALRPAVAAMDLQQLAALDESPAYS